MAADKKDEKQKPLEKMTVKELRELAKEIPEITGVHGMNKEDLLSAIKKAKGIAEAPKKKGGSTRELKSKIKAYKAKKEEAAKQQDNKMVTIYRRRISRLKKKTRQAA